MKSKKHYLWWMGSEVDGMQWEHWTERPGFKIIVDWCFVLQVMLVMMMIFIDVCDVLSVVVLCYLVLVIHTYFKPNHDIFAHFEWFSCLNLS